VTPAPPSATPDRHVPVMLDRVVALLAPALADSEAVLIDATLGLGGHSEALLRRFPHLRVVGLDRDTEALSLASQRLTPFADRLTVVHAVYDELPQVLARLGLRGVHGVLFDLGVSSLQLDEPERGFAYRFDAPLDMRMDQHQGPTAADVVNGYDAAALARVLRTYGEERFARRIADAIVTARADEPVTSTQRLAELVRSAVPAATRRTGGHPAKRTFQALRIEVNDELGAVARAVPAAVDALVLHGRIAVLAYHSLEDRIVKQVLAGRSRDRAPAGLPVVPEADRAELRLLTRGAERPAPDEEQDNPRAASARLRAAERIREAA
jgi:16S rRNA (cytosine1402-N4)-methyltransferase